MRIRYAPRAFSDRRSIADYLNERSPEGARNVQRAIVQAIRSLKEYPRLGQLTSVAEVRELTVP
jgi:plasmid stabilization system protein ParE